ncbi:LemA family protein [Candidatus Thorarchaeota archaeon]|nr:MAG: LemA family protein [Candidatus Thorarchaeota archaeon]
MEGKQIACIVVLGLVIVGVGFSASVIMTYNDLVAAQNDAKNKWTHIQIQYELKIALIPQLIDVVQNYTAFEQETLTQITELRTQWLSLNNSPSEQANISTQLNVAFDALFVAIQENYPTLYASELYQDLFVEITSTENKIAMAKLDYNDAVTEYNTKLMQFPGNIVAGIFSLQPMILYASG